MKKLLLIMLMLVQTFWVFGQAGKNDLSFNGDLVDYGDGPNNQIRSFSVQEDQKIILGGFFTSYNGESRNYISRINTDGSLDKSFNPGVGANNYVFCTDIQKDGKILIGGWFTSYNQNNVNRIARVNQDGSLDSSFDIGTGVNGTVWDIKEQSDGKILLVGSFTTFNSFSRNRIVRLNSDGSIDSTFMPGTGANGTINSFIVQSDNRIVIVGDFTSFRGVPRNRIARINPDGTLDSSFNPGLGTDLPISSIDIQNDGKLIIGGQFTSYGNNIRRRIARINQDGSIDSSFNHSFGAGGNIRSVKILDNEKILIAGMFSSYDGIEIGNVARINSDGSLDQSFKTKNIENQSGVPADVFTLAIQNDEKILVGGSFISIGNNGIPYFARIEANGETDLSLTNNVGANNIIFSTSIQMDKKIILGGGFTSYNKHLINRICRINPNGSIDNSFNPGLGANGIIRDIKIQKDGKLIIAGDFTSFDGVRRNSIARINEDGSLDFSFDPGSGASNTIYSVTILENNKIFIGGTFTSFDGNPSNRMAVLNSNGTLDTNFNIGLGADWWVFASEVQPDGKILIGGDFSSIDGEARFRLARLEKDGELDLSFSPGGTGGIVRSIKLQKDGKIILGGSFNSFNSVSRNRIARLESDGSLDLTFDPGLGANNTVFSTSIQQDGKIVIGGSFTSFNGQGSNRIIRIETNGKIDPTFNSGQGANNVIYSTEFQENGAIFIAGEFSQYDNINRVRITRLLNDIEPDDKDPHIPDLEILPLIEAQCVVNFEDLTIPTATSKEGESIQGTTDGSIFPIISQGSSIITWTYTDAGGNSSTQTQEIQIKDTELPEIQAGSDITVESDEGLCEAMVEILTATANDNCEVGAPTGIRSDGEPLDAPYPVGLTTITWNVTDINGNEAEEAIQTITVNDKESPVIVAADQSATAETGLCSAIISLEVNATDNCGVGDPIGSRSDGEPLDAPFPVGITTVTWNVTDINGNEAEPVIQVITVTDDEIPEVKTKNAIIELQAGSTYPLSVDEIDDGSTDNCGIDSRTLDKTLFTEEDEGENIVTLTILDPAGNENSAQATVIVTVNRDNECVVAFAKDIVLILDRNGTASIRANQVDDGSFTNCSNRIVTRELEKSVFTCADLGEQMVGFRAIDRDGNLGETQFKVTILDETEPRVANIPNLRVTLGTDEIYVLPDLRSTVNASDNCAVVEYIQIPEPGTIYDAAGTYSIMLRAIDSSGNVGEKTGTLNIRQNINNRLLDENSYLDKEFGNLSWSQEHDELESGQLMNQLLLDILPNSIKIYPNPASQETNIMVGLSQESRVEIRIFDTAGRLVFFEESQQEGNFTRSIAINGLSIGLYHVVVKIDQQYLQGRLIKK